MNITEAYGKVRIGDFEFYGQIETDKFCPKCKFNLVYYDDFDSYFCAKCNRWMESNCGDPTCKYCAKRPETPLNHK